MGIARNGADGVAFVLLVLASTPGLAAGTGVFVNGSELKPETLRALQQAYPVAIAAGRYWYDAQSGAWGLEGQPIAGQMLPGLALGGALKADASKGSSGVFLNGRQLTVGEKTYLEMLCQTPVLPARYWVTAQGMGGYEGGPPSFNLAQCPGLARGNGNGGARSSSRTYCDANGNCTSTGVLGTINTGR